MKKLFLAAAVAGLMFGGFAQAQESFVKPTTGTIKLDVRLAGIIPDESGAIVSRTGAATGLNVAVNDAYVPTIGLEYYLNPNVWLEVIAGTGNHTVRAVGGTANVVVQKLWHVPPTVTAKYHFTPEARVSPYVGAGLTYI